VSRREARPFAGILSPIAFLFNRCRTFRHLFVARRVLWTFLHLRSGRHGFSPSEVCCDVAALRCFFHPPPSLRRNIMFPLSQARAFRCDFSSIPLFRILSFDRSFSFPSLAFLYPKGGCRFLLRTFSGTPFPSMVRTIPPLRCFK